MADAARTSVHRLAVLTAGIAGAFVLTVACVLLYLHGTATTNDPWKSPQLLELKSRLQAAPKDEAVKNRIRDLDLQFRQRYAQRRRLQAQGGWLLLAGSVVVILSLQAARKTNALPPQPRPDPAAATRLARLAASSRRSVAVAGGAFAAASLVVAWGLRSEFLPAPPAPDTSAAAAPPSLPSDSEFARNWPRFRGPDGGGVSAQAGTPLRWDAKSGAGIAWKTPVPAPGFNSPIVWGDRVFLSGATREAQLVFCFDATNGRLLWQCPITTTRSAAPAKAPELAEQTGYAASTLATDGRNVYAIFGHGNLAAVNFAGKQVWSKHLGVPQNPYGHATSLAVWQGRVLVQFDQGESEPGNSRLLSFDGLTGRLVWEKARPVSSSWATPIVIQAAGRTQILTLGSPFVISYAVADGAELWRWEGLSGEVTPSPVFAGGLLLAVSPGNKLFALRTDGAGTLGPSQVAWQTEDNVPDVTSPVSDGTWAYTVTSGGLLACFSMKDGKKLWEKDLESEVQTSPALIGGRLHVSLTNGTTIVAEAGPEYRELARNTLGEKLFASPAVAGGRLYLRGLQHLFCLSGDSAAKTPPATP
jgi:outer membrane protein assembly factor BamB